MTREEREIHAEARIGEGLSQWPHRPGVAGETVQDEHPVRPVGGGERLGPGHEVLGVIVPRWRVGVVGHPAIVMPGPLRP